MIKRILMLVAPYGFRDEEYFETKKILEVNNFVVITASREVKVAKSKFGHRVLVDIDIYDVNVNNYDGMVVIGGAKAMMYKNDLKIHNILRSFEMEGKLIGARGIAPKILAYSDVLKGKKATIWDEDGMQHLVINNFGGKYVETDIVEDGNIITGDCIYSTKEFGKRIVDWFEKNK